ncbi:MAG: ATP-binding protein, partial [Candidatus Helarchaeota archaeon]|nr:ATP-binding protein [Candidatus Helarchaeota archaeon]
MSIEKGKVHFISDTHLLEELGERLVASPSIAIAELIKNAFDADAVECHVWQGPGRDKIFVSDDGHGITKDEFLTKWMTVATQNKRDSPLSRSYNRVVTGAKGVGRFAARFLGSTLKLQSYSYDTKAGAHARLEATFDWTSFDHSRPLTEIEIPYTYELGVESEEHGTQLEIESLRIEWDANTESRVRREVLGMCSPFPSLEHGNQLKRGKTDPGFSVLFAPPGQKTRPEADVASEVLDRYLARLRIARHEGKVEYTIIFREDDTPRQFHYNVNTDMIGPLHADIRYMPRGKGQFADFKHVSGKDAYQWVRESSGVKIFDHGFRVPPYGDKDDDWLRLASDTASNRRQWRSTIAESIFPRADLDKKESRDPALFLPGNHQLLGAVFLNSDQSKKAEQDKVAVQRLQIAMDRQGY